MTDFSAVAGDMWNELENLRQHWEGTEREGFIQAHIDRYEQLAGLVERDGSSSTPPDDAKPTPTCCGVPMVKAYGSGEFNCPTCGNDRSPIDSAPKTTLSGVPTAAYWPEDTR